MKDSSNFILLSLIYIISLIIIYFKKSHIKTNELKIYSLLLITNFFGLLLELGCIFSSRIYGISDIKTLFINKAYLIYLIIFCILFLKYCIVISINNYQQKKNIIKIINYIYIIIFSIIIIFSPINIHIDNSTYSDGPAINVVYFAVTFVIFIAVINMLKNYNQIKNKNYAPLFIFIIGLAIVSFIQKKEPSFTLITTLESFVLLIMYFTIENPDVKMLKEINTNRSIIEKNNEEKSNLLFKISQDVREPIKEIEKKSRNILHEDNIKEIKMYASDINYESLHVSKMINSVLDISQIDITNIKIYNNSYNIYNVFNEIILIMNNKFNDNIEFKYSITNNIPNSLYGDSLKLKQILSSILLNSIKYTKKGFVDIDINSIVRYDICRLIITISDSGKGISIDKINNILETKEELTKDELNKIEKLDVDLKITKKIIDMLGGTLLIKSDLNNGSMFTVILDQRISEKSNLNNQVITNKKRVLLIDDNYQELQHIKYILKRNNLNVTTSMFGKDCIDRIRNKEKYDLIIIDDEMQPDNAIETKQELDKIKNKIKIIIMISQIKEQIKNHYTNDYKFNDILLKRDLDNELKRIINKYI